jgi:hypothetical protein
MKKTMPTVRKVPMKAPLTPAMASKIRVAATKAMSK